MNNCVEHPLGILCRCKEYEKIVDNIKIYKPGTRNPYLPKLIFTESSTPNIMWVPRKFEKNVNHTKPVLIYDSKEEKKSYPCSVEKKWIPVQLDLISSKNLRENLSFLHQGSPSTQSSETNTLTDMLPHRGRSVKRKDIEWGVGSHVTPVQMTDEPETNFSAVRGCFSTWAEAFVNSTGQFPY